MTDEKYGFGHKPGSVDYMTVRTVERNAQFALPYLVHGQNLLDCGCGPGSITVGLARRVTPGKVIGIDLDVAQAAPILAAAKAEGVDNLEFQPANVCALPFHDNEFDFVFSHTLLCHVVDIDKAMRELWRVLRPGGCIALRDIVGSKRILSHDYPRIILGDALVNRAITQAGGDPDRGAKLGTLLHKAGFVRLRLSASYDVPSTEEKAGYYDREADLLEHTGIAETCIRHGWASRVEIGEVAAEWRRFGREPDTLFALPFGEAVAWKPA